MIVIVSVAVGSGLLYLALPSWRRSAVRAAKRRIVEVATRLGWVGKVKITLAFLQIWANIPEV